MLERMHAIGGQVLVTGGNLPLEWGEEECTIEGLSLDDVHALVF